MAQAQKRAAMEEQKAAMREQKQAMMQQILSDEARVRLGNIAAVKPDKAEKLETIIIQNAQRGTFQGKVTESQLIDLLEQVSAAEGSSGASGVSVQRSKHRFDDDEDLNIDDMDL